MTASDQLFVTGMLRSGTSLLQAILTNHPQLFVAYQPFSQLYLDVKQHFLDSEGIKRRLPLGDGMDGPSDEPERFRRWLQEKEFKGEIAERLVRRSVTGKGGSCAGLADILPAAGGHFVEIQTEMHNALAQHFGKRKAAWSGSKEILCEEYLPHLLEKGRRCLLVVRDPRAVVASANSGRYRNMVGDCYPILMLVRIWRKSVAYALGLAESPHLIVIRYEDLVQSTEATLGSIARFLQVEPFAQNALRGHLLDHTGQLWLGNSSFGNKATIDVNSVGSWRKCLPNSVIELIETLCHPEMLAMGYLTHFVNSSDCSRVVGDFMEDPEGLRGSYLDQYAMSGTERARELSRLQELHDYTNSFDSSNKLFVWHSAKKKLAEVLKAAESGYMQPLF